MPVGRRHGRFNQEGDLSPRISPWGQLMWQVTPLLINRPDPIGSQGTGAFGGTYGVMSTRSASVVALAQPGGYWGDLPTSMQDFVDAPPPWKRA